MLAVTFAGTWWWWLIAMIVCYAVAILNFRKKFKTFGSTASSLLNANDEDEAEKAVKKGVNSFGSFIGSHILFAGLGAIFSLLLVISIIFKIVEALISGS